MKGCIGLVISVSSLSRLESNSNDLEKDLLLEKVAEVLDKAAVSAVLAVKLHLKEKIGPLGRACTNINVFPDHASCLNQWRSRSVIVSGCRLTVEKVRVRCFDAMFPDGQFKQICSL